MSTESKKPKKNEIIVGILFPVIAGAILFIIEPTRDFIISIIKNIIDFIIDVFKVVFNYLKSSHEINGLVFILLVGISITFFVLLIIFIIESLKGKAYKDYQEDIFYGLKWRWSWGHLGAENLWCFCPTCDFELAYDDSTTHRYSHDSNPRTDFICDHCQKVVGSVKNQNKDYIISIIEREIRRKIRNNLHLAQEKKA